MLIMSKMYEEFIKEVKELAISNNDNDLLNKALDFERRNKKILIVGLGLLGGSFAQGLSDYGYEVGAIDTNKDSIDYAIKTNIIKHGSTEVSFEYVNSFDVIIFALYPHVFVEWLRKYQSYIKKSAIISDVTGVKTWLINELNSFIRKDINLVLAHPMAGREVYGVRNSDKNMFIGANYIITPLDDTSIEAIDFMKDIAKKLGFKNIVCLSVKEHDEMIGFLSQLTHCIAISLMTCKESEHLVEYTGDSFRDLTRIAKINDEMWSELFLINKDELVSQMDLFLDQFTKLKKSIETGDVKEMKNIMRLSTLRRSYFDK